MWNVINFVRANRTISGFDISDYVRNTLGYPDKSAGGCIARAIQYGHLRITGTKLVNGKVYNIYQ